MYFIAKAVFGGIVEAKRIMFLGITLTVSRMGSIQIVLKQKD